METYSLLNIPLQNIPKKSLFSLFEDAFTQKKCTHIATINPEFFVELNQNRAFEKLLQNTTNIVDGVGIQVMLKILSKKNISRVAGVTIAEEICHFASKNKKSVFFLGGYNVAKSAANVMKKKYPNLIIAGTCNGDEHTFQEVLDAKPDIILVAFGAPKQEFWIQKNKDNIPSLRLAVGIGGTFDFWTNKVQRAPVWMQEIGCEWLYRLVKQPSRYKRILNAVVVFPWLCVKDKFL